MSVDKLQERIRKLKNPSVVDFNMLPEHIPPYIQERDTFFVSAYEYVCTELLAGLKDIVPAVRFSLGALSLFGPDGMVVLQKLLLAAKKLGYYVLLDAPDAFSRQDTVRSAELLFAENSDFAFDGLIVNAYIGSDSIRPYGEKMKNADKDLFVIVRTSNKSAPELQDLLTGTRVMHMAAADVVNRYSETMVGRSGYSKIGAVAAASSASCLRNIRAAYKSLFLLLDGYDYPNANAKNCSYAFDQLGHGAAAIAGISVTAAWQEQPVDQREFVRLAIESAERMKKNLLRYITIL
ncbi:MAG: hypothetical protein IKU57_01300 [Oscillospiraceae bacterium]|nr:hypothetical protein [Oscillospiraceae bacterium]